MRGITKSITFKIFHQYRSNYFLYNELCSETFFLIANVPKLF